MAIKRRTKDNGLDPLYQLSESVAVLETATEGNQRQIAEIATNTNKAINDLATNTSRQFKDISIVLEKQGVQTNSRLETLVENFQSSQKPNWPVWIAGITLVAMLLTGAMWIISLSTENTVYKNLIPLQSALDSNSARDQVSETDRKKLNDGQEVNRSSIEEIKADNQVLHAAFAEAETQIDSMAQSLNIQFAEGQRMQSNIQNALHELGKMPPPPAGPWYFPNISNRGQGPLKNK